MAKFFRKRPLRARDDQVTNAANLTLRQSLVPLCLVTILFFLWVRVCVRRSSTVAALIMVVIIGLCVRPPGRPEQALPEHTGNHTLALVGAASSVFRVSPVLHSPWIKR